jgi:serine/threonine protein kinase
VVHDGEDIAVKKLYQLQGLDDKDFDNEILNFNKAHHKNIVRLIGYCHETHRRCIEHKGDLIFVIRTERFLCFEYMQGGSLDKHIEGNYIMTDSLLYVLPLVCMTKMNGSEECTHFSPFLFFPCNGR